MNLRHKASNTAISVGRRLFANTPIQKFEIVTKIYRKVFQLGYGADEVTANFRGLQLTAPTSDATIVPGLVVGFYESIEIDVFERLAARSKSIVDVGANIGLYSCLAARLTPESVSITAYEPVPENLDYLRRNVEANGYTSRIDVQAAAVGESSGSIEMHIEKDNIGTHSISEQNTHGSTDALTVPLVTLDASVPGAVDLLKVDVEGYDVAVLRGAAQLLQRDKPTLFAEFIPKSIENCGYSHVEFLDIVFGIYPYVYAVEEAPANFSLCTREQLLARAHSDKNTNIIATANEEHASIIKSMQSSTLTRRN